MLPFIEDLGNRSRANTVFDTMRSMEPTPSPAPEVGPYSSLFDWKTEAKRSIDEINKLQEFEKKLARSSAIVDAFRVLTQGIGATQGASIPREAPNNNVLSALQNYRTLSLEKRNALDKWRLFNIENRSRDLNWALQNQARTEGYQHDINMLGERQAFEQQQTRQEQEFRTAEREAGQRFAADEKATERGFASAESEKDRAARLQLQKEADAARQKLYGEYYRQGGWRTVRGVYERMDPNLRMQINNELIRISGQKAQSAKDAGQTYRIPDAIRAIQRNEVVRDESIDQVLMENLPELMKRIPELGQQYPELLRVAQQQEQQTAQTTQPQSPGRITIDPRVAYDAVLKVINNPRFSTKSGRVIRNEIADGIRYAYPQMSKSEAKDLAEQALNQYRSQIKGVMNGQQ